MAVLWIGSKAPTLRLKLAYVAWEEELLRETMGELAGWSEAAPSKLVAHVEEDDGTDEGLLYTLDLEPGVASPAALEGITVRSFAYGAVARTPDAPALIETLQACDAVVLVARADDDGMSGAVRAFSRSLVCLVENGGELPGMPFVLQWTRAPGATPEEVSPLVESLGDLYATVASPGLGGALRRLFGKTPRLSIETVEATQGEEDGVRRSLSAASRAALASSRVAAYVAGLRG